MQTGRRSLEKANQFFQDTITRRHRPDYQIVLYMGLLMLLGLIVMFAIGPQRANVLNIANGTDFYTGSYFFIKQSASVFLALVAFVVMAMAPFELLKKHAKTILIIGLAACALLAIAGWTGMGIAMCSHGACRWFNLGVFGTLQPAELLKFGVLLFTAGFLGMRMKQGLINDRDKTVIPLLAVLAVASLFVIIIQKDMGTGIAMFAIIASMLVVSGMSKKVGLMLAIGALVAGLLFIVTAPHRIERVQTFLTGDSSMTTGDADANYHINHAKIAIGSGGFMGVGIGNSVQATGYLPEAINDSVFAILGEIFGFVGLVIILLLFSALLLRLLNISDHLASPWMKLVVAGIFGWLAAHVILNVAAMIGVFPLTGVTLPLLSFGGTSMIFIAGALGLAFQLSRYTAHGSINKEMNYEDISSRRGVGRTRYAGRRSPSRT